MLNPILVFYIKYSLKYYRVQYIHRVQIDKHYILDMKSLSSGQARKNFADTLNRVSYGSEHIAIERSGKEPVYMIPAKDYELFQHLLQQAEDKIDLQEAESRMNDPEQKKIEFDDFFADL